MKHVYAETTIVSYLVARPGRDLVQAARQELTREWWESRRQDFEIYVSQLVVEESAEGDADAASRRTEILQDLPRLDVTDDVTSVAEALVSEGVLPREAADDAVHLAAAAVHGTDFLLTWNCRHLANAELTEPAGTLLRAKGYKPPVVCTPEELMGG